MNPEMVKAQALDGILRRAIDEAFEAGMNAGYNDAIRILECMAGTDGDILEPREYARECAEALKNNRRDDDEGRRESQSGCA